MAQPSTVGVGRRTHPQITLRCQGGDFEDQSAGFGKEIFGPVRTHPPFEHRQVLRIFPHLGQRDLVGAERPFDLPAVDDTGAGPTLRHLKGWASPRIRRR